jgi:hypothetical protein
MGILTLGLLGAAALFPVGGFYMQKADIADRGSAIAQSVMSDIVARGIVSPKAWCAMVPAQSTANPAQANLAHYYFDGIDGKYSNASPKTPTTLNATFTRPFAEALGQSLKLNTDPVVLSRQFGNAYVLDPMYVANAAVKTSNINNIVAYPFPASASRSFPRTGGTWGYYKDPAWDTWRGAISGPMASQRVWPIRRMTLQGNDGWAMDQTTADFYFRGNDDLATDFPSRDDRPARQNWETTVVSNTNIPLAREWAGDYSWIVSVVPTTNDARDGLSRNPEGYTYNVSVVVFYKRPLPSEPATSSATSAAAASSERVVGASIISSGLSGGEILLTEIADNTTSPFESLKKGEWIMLCGPHPNTTATTPRFVMNWYQVLSIEGADQKLDQYGQPSSNPSELPRRLIAVRGPQWPWQPTYNAGYGSAGISNDLCVGICRGAVAVHTKTMRLEGSRGDGMAIVSPTGETSRNTLFPL